MAKIYINAGHWEDDPGVTQGIYNERNLVVKIREELKKLLPSALYVPDELNLQESIDWVKETAEPGDIAIDIHLNAHNDKNVRGTECYYYKNKELAKNLSRQVARELHIHNRGAKPDKEAWVGSLGWVRQLNEISCLSVVLECAYMTNLFDLDLMARHEGHKSVAQAIYDVLVYSDQKKLQAEIISLRELVRQLIAFIVKLVTNKK